MIDGRQMVLLLAEGRGKRNEVLGSEGMSRKLAARESSHSHHSSKEDIGETAAKSGKKRLRSEDKE